MFNANVIATIVSTENFGARAVFSPKKGKVSRTAYGAEQGVVGNAETCALLVAAHTLEQYIAQFDAGNWHGKIALVMPRQASIRANHIRGLLKAGNSAADVAELCAGAVSKSFTMDEAHLSAIQMFAVQMEQFLNEDGLDIRTYDSFNLNYWRVEGENLKDGQHIELVSVTDRGQTYSATEDGEVVCENNGVSGEFEVHAYREGRRNIFVVDREANLETSYGKRLTNIRKVMAKTLELLPVEADVDDIEVTEGDEVAC